MAGNKLPATIVVIGVILLIIVGVIAYNIGLQSSAGAKTVTLTRTKTETITKTVTVTKTIAKTVTTTTTTTTTKTALPPLPSPDKVRGEIDFYTSIPKSLAEELVKMFEEKYPNVKVNLYRSGTSKIMAKLLAEVESGKIIADVVWVADPASIIVLKNKGLLMKYEPPEAKLIPFKDPDGYWVAGRIILQVIAYNPSIIKNPPKKWIDLISENFINTLPKEWRNTNWIAMPNPLYSGAVTATVYALTEKYGWDYFLKLKKLGLVVEKSNGVVLQGILAGKYPIGITLDYMVRLKKAAGENIDMVFPSDGVIAIPSPIAIMKNTPYPEVAKAFVRFMLSEEVQKKLAEWGVIPARIDVQPPKGTPQLSQLPIIKIDWNALASKLEEIRSTFEDKILSP